MSLILILEVDIYTISLP